MLSSTWTTIYPNFTTVTTQFTRTTSKCVETTMAGTFTDPDKLNVLNMLVFTPQMWVSMRVSRPSICSATVSLVRRTAKAISSGDCWQLASRNKLATTPGEHHYMQPVI